MEAANIVLFNSTKGPCYRVWFYKSELILNSKRYKPTTQPTRVTHSNRDDCLFTLITQFLNNYTVE